MTRPALITGVVFLMAVAVQHQAPADAPPPNPPVLWYAQPAVRWMEALPVGNGRIGAMVFGGTDTSRIALDESTVWSGEPSDQHENPRMREHLDEIRKALFEGRYAEAQGLCRQYVLGRELNYGSHLPVGNLLLRFGGGDGEVRGYRRDLDLDRAIAGVTHARGKFKYSTEVFCSNVDQVLVVRISCDTAGGLSFEAAMNGGDLPFQTHADGDTLVMTGSAFEKKHSDGKTGVAFRSEVRALATGGSVEASGADLKIVNADEVTLLVAVNTNYHDTDAAARCRAQLDAATAKGYEQLRDAHVADHQRLFRRVTLDLGTADAAKLPTDLRLERLKNGKDDPQLVSTFFQYGRYLLIAGSREDSPLPLNLQGIWNDNLACNMGWTCDFHMDINTQQNYWPAESCNLSECTAPLFRLVESLQEPGARTARECYGCGGWVCHIFTNAWGFTSPGWGLGWGVHDTGGAWLATHLWQHYDFTGDREFLAKQAYPVLKGSAQFFLDAMVEDPVHHWLVTGPAPSPENSYIAPDGKVCTESMGPTCDAVILRELFTECIESSRILGVDDEFRAKLEAAREKLPPLCIGKHGQVQEWLEDFEEAIPNHRHMTHLLALYPYDQIDARRTPEFAKAARVTIERRSGRADWEDVEWSRGNLINFYARLLDGEAALDSVRLLMTKLSDKNLMTVSAAGIAGAQENIFAIDGNTSGTNGIGEMLLQSQGGELSLLPALPKAWAHGKVAGLRARGGYTVDIAWKDGRLSEATIRADRDGTCTVRTAEPANVTKKGQPSDVIHPEPGLAVFGLSAGESCLITNENCDAK